VRDQALLESAIDRSRNVAAYGESPTLFELAAALCLGIIRNHPFVDGNKRAGILSAVAFLDLNGYDFRPDEAEMVHVIMAAADGKADEALLAGWFSDYATRKKSSGGGN
jgi:death-on-curing protein